MVMGMSDGFQCVLECTLLPLIDFSFVRIAFETVTA